MKSKTPGKEHRKRLKNVEESLETYLSDLGVDQDVETSLPQVSPEEFKKMRDQLNSKAPVSDNAQQSPFVVEVKTTLTEAQEDQLISLRRALIKNRTDQKKGELIGDAEIIRSLIDLIPDLGLNPRNIYTVQDLRRLLLDSLNRSTQD